MIHKSGTQHGRFENAHIQHGLDCRTYLAIAALYLVSALGFALPLAGADCSSPSFTVDKSEVRFGEPIMVTGSGWGDDCYDTGIPEGAAGVLGDPIRDISVYAIQGSDEVVVAKGNADNAYAFEVEVFVPDEFAAGEFKIQVDFIGGSSREHGYGAKTVILVDFGTGTRTSGLERATPTFGPTTRVVQSSTTTTIQTDAAGSSRPAETDESENNNSRSYLIAGLGLGAVAVALTAAARSAKRRRQAESVT